MWPRRVTIALAIVLMLQAGFLAVWVTAASPVSLAYILMALSALAMGLQMNAIRDLHVPCISTMACTASFIDLFSGLATWSLTAHSARRLAATMVSMAAGAFLERAGERGNPRRVVASKQASHLSAPQTAISVWTVLGAGRRDTRRIHSRPPRCCSISRAAPSASPARNCASSRRREPAMIPLDAGPTATIRSCSGP